MAVHPALIVCGLWSAARDVPIPAHIAPSSCDAMFLLPVARNVLYFLLQAFLLVSDSDENEDEEMLVVLFAHLVGSCMIKEGQGSIPPLADLQLGKKAIICLIKVFKILPQCIS